MSACRQRHSVQLVTAGNLGLQGGRSGQCSMVSEVCPAQCTAAPACRLRLHCAGQSDARSEYACSIRHRHCLAGNRCLDIAAVMSSAWHGPCRPVMPGWQPGPLHVVDPATAGAAPHSASGQHVIVCLARCITQSLSISTLSLPHASQSTPPACKGATLKVFKQRQCCSLLHRHQECNGACQSAASTHPC